jgi:hypothetical protein
LTRAASILPVRLPRGSRKAAARWHAEWSVANRYGADELDAAIRQALERGVPHPNAVRLALERRRERRNEAPPVAVELPDHIKTRDAAVRPHRLETYDQLKDQTNNDQTNKDETDD